jgi:hypothetical protein
LYNIFVDSEALQYSEILGMNGAWAIFLLAIVDDFVS